VSLEGLLAADPDVIFVKDGDSAGARERLRQRIEAVKAHPVWREMRAVREDRIVLLPPGPFSIPGPRMVQAYAEIAAGLWPELDVPHHIAEPDSLDE
jgi:iron complex transport system substrate-binding protein